MASTQPHSGGGGVSLDFSFVPDPIRVTRKSGGFWEIQGADYIGFRQTLRCTKRQIAVRMARFDWHAPGIDSHSDRTGIELVCPLACDSPCVLPLCADGTH